MKAIKRIGLGLGDLSHLLHAPKAFLKRASPCSFQIRQEIEQFGINIYQFPECDSDEDDEFQQQDQILKVPDLDSKRVSFSETVFSPYI